MEENQREKERDRSRRPERPTRFTDAGRDRSSDRGERESKRVIVSNIPYEYRWTELKDLFKDQVGDVAYVELFTDDNGKPRGCGVVEFTTIEAKKKAFFLMHRYELKGRKLVIKEETGNERRNNTRSEGGGGGGRNHRDDKDNWNKPRDSEDFNTYGLSLQFLDSINVQPPLVKRIFVANLDYKADRAKIKEVFKMAGKVRNIDLAVDKDGHSRGFAVIEFDHPVEAVQAISMFDKQLLYDRRMTARMDRGSDKFEMRLPDGLKGIGVGLGPNGEPLKDVARNLSQGNAPGNLSLAGSVPTMGAGVLGPVPSAAAGVALNGLGNNLAANPLGNNPLGGGLSLQALGLTGLGALQNQLLQQGLTANDLATVLAAQSAANVNLNNAANTLNLANNDGLGPSGMGNNQMSNNMMGNNSMSSGPLSGSRGNMGGQMGGQMGSQMGSQMGGSMGGQMSHGVSMPAQGYSREPSSQNNRDKATDMVIIANLPPTVTWQLIREKFSECGDVKFAEMTAPDTAIVRFHKDWEAERAIKMFDRTRIDGRTIDVRYF